MAYSTPPTSPAGPSVLSWKEEPPFSYSTLGMTNQSTRCCTRMPRMMPSTVKTAVVTARQLWRGSIDSIR